MNQNAQKKISVLENTRKKDRTKLQQNTQNTNFLSGRIDLPGKTVWLEPDDTLIDRFIIKKCLGHGSLGTVYLAQDTLRDNEIALKTVDVGPLSEDMSSFALKREMNIYNQIDDYQYVIRMFDLHFVPWGGTGLLVMSMEYANGGTFRKWLLNHANDIQARMTTGLEYIKMACAGVGTIHDAQITHLDLKPENLLFTDNLVKISDFGASLCTQRLKQESIFLHQDTSSEKGTPAYMSPEHFLAPHPEDIGPPADIYSLGIMLFEIFHPNCRPPFGGSYDRLRELHLNVPAPRIPGIDDNLANIVARCLEKKPDDRYQSAWDLLEDLEEGICSIKDSNDPRCDTEKEIPEDIERLWQSACQTFSQGKFNEAFQLTKKLLSTDPDNAAAQILRDELRTRFDQAEGFYQTIARDLPDRDLHELTTLLIEAANLFPDHPSGRLIQSQIAIKASEYRKMMEQGLSALQTNNWEAALEFFKKANQYHPSTPHLNPLIEKLYRLKDLYAQIHHALVSSDFEKALTIASIVDDMVDNMKNSMRALKEDVEDEHENCL